MSQFLERVGRLCARHPWRTLGAWLIVAAIVGSLGATLGHFNDNFSVPQTESQHAVDILHARFSAQTRASTTVVFHARSGNLTDAEPRAAIESALDAVGSLPHVASVDSPFAPGARTLSPVKPIAYATVDYRVPGSAITRRDYDRLQSALAPARHAGLQVEMEGDVAGVGANDHSTGSSEIYGIVAAVVILLFAFGSLAAMGIPVGIALIALAVGLSIVKIMSATFPVSSVAPAIATMIGLGVGIDYSLFVVTRHREQLASGMTVEASAGHANGTSGMAVVFAGTTVVIAICGLVAAGIPMVSAMGYSAAAVVAVSVTAAVTLLPAFLGLIGTKINSLRLPWIKQHEMETHLHPEKILRSLWARWAFHISRHPWKYTVVVFLALVVVALPTLSMRLGEPDNSTLPKTSTRRRAYDLLSEGFGPGFNGPLLLVVQLPRGTGSAALTPIEAAVRADRDVVYVEPAQLNKTRSTAVIAALPKSGPQDARTARLVRHLRDDVLPHAIAGTDIRVYVGGATATFIDISARVAERIPFFIGAVLLLSFVLLMIVFRSILVPLKAAVMNLLSIGAAYGVIVAIFQWGWFGSLFGVHESVPIISFVPMMMFAILFGLSMDYEVFLLSRVREEWLRTGDSRLSVSHGVAATARVISSAALIMIAVFGSFVLAKDTTVKMMGIGLATAILVDATIIRLVLVPATMELLGDANWWLPGPLDRILPHLDLEHAEITDPAELEAAVTETFAPEDAAVVDGGESATASALSGTSRRTDDP